MTVHSAIRFIAWIVAGLYLLLWIAAAWFVDDGGLIRDNASCIRVEGNPLFWNCDGFAMSVFANAVAMALATTFLAPLAVAAALSNPVFWSVALPVVATNLLGIAAMVYAILRLVGWGVRGSISFVTGR